MFENNIEYKVGDNVIIYHMNKKHNSKIFRVNEDETFYPYIITSPLKNY